MSDTTTLEEVPISETRLSYIARLWDQDLFLLFDGDLLHLKENSYNWKTGAEVKNVSNPEKVNELSKHNLERVQHILTQIDKEYKNDKGKI